MSGDGILEWEHMYPRSRGGSDRVKNASLACATCNSDKGSQTLKEWLDVINLRVKKESGKRKELDEKRAELVRNILEGKNAVKPLRYAAWVTSSRRYVEKYLFTRFQTVECSSGGRTKYNRTQLKYPKDHHYDALCVGNVSEQGSVDCTNGYFLYAKAMGRGSRLRGNINDCGIIIAKYKYRHKIVNGFQTGDIVVVELPHRNKRPYKYEGRHVGRLIVRSSGTFDIKILSGAKFSFSSRFCRLLQNNSGYQFETRRTIPHSN